ncbi:MAG: hypothetical protein MR711_12175 [Selenomonas sp.]|uniref:hypothetical protein n=1 Tax=Selenomonas sp. TaxID=2053611 RepID=UPI0025F244C8|nr:hypothetical protein [Selenomonas sp.]MCI6086974.1 hypothetical protein [Selenomonas sp.]
MSEIKEDRRPFVRWLALRVTQRELLELRSTMNIMERYLESEGRSADIIYRAARNFNRCVLEKYQKQFQNDSYFHYLHGNRMEDVQTIFSYLIEFASWHRYSDTKLLDETTEASMVCCPYTDAPREEQNRFSEVDELLKNEKFLALRTALVQNGIQTIDQLRALNLWSFMNRYELYSIGTRQKVLEEVTALLYPVAENDESQLFVLQVGDDAYKGDTPSDAFLRFCDEMLRRYPLQFRLLAGSKLRDGSIPVRLAKDEDHLQKLTNFSAYIRGNLSEADVSRYAEWVCSKCNEGDLIVRVTAPKKMTYEPHRTETLYVAESSNPADQAQADEDPQEQPVKTHDVNPEVARMEEIIFGADTNGMSYEALKTSLGTTMFATKQLVAEAMHIVDMDGRLIHQDALLGWEDAANQMDELLEKLMRKNDGYVSSKQLYEYAKVEMNMFLNDNRLDEERLVYDMAQHLFEKAGYHGRHYKFSGKMHISRLEDDIATNFDIYKKYANEQGGVFSFSALAEYLERVGIATINLRMQMQIGSKPIFFYYENGILMYAESMHIDEGWLDTVKKKLAALLDEAGGHIILRNLPAAWLEQLPVLPESQPWTPLLLQSILRCYHKQLDARTIPAMRGQSMETLHAMLVTGDSVIQSFGDVVVTWLMDNEIEQRAFEAEELREDLVEAGILQGNELIWNMPKALKKDERFAWDASGSRVTILVR